GGVFYAVPLAVFCIDPQMACEAASWLLVAHAVRSFGQYNLYRGKIYELADSVIQHGMDRAAARAALEPHREFINRNAEIAVHFGSQGWGFLFLAPICSAAGYPLSRLCAKSAPVRQFQDFVKSHTIEKWSGPLAHDYAPWIASLFSYDPP